MPENLLQRCPCCFLVMFSFCFLTSCLSSKNEADKPENNLSQPGSLQQQIQPSKTLPPNTVQLGAVITAYDAQNQLYRIRIKEIVGYGMGTPSLAAGTEISVRLAESAFDKANGETKIAEFIEMGTPIILNLRNSDAIKIGQRKSDSWTIVKIGVNQ